MASLPRAVVLLTQKLINDAFAKRGTLTIKARHAIDHRQERGPALIYTAVTAQINVRQFSRKESA
jgi:hypothetical protein